MNKYIFTFGVGQPLGGYCQPIFAENFLKAREKMVELHGRNWCAGYTELEWQKAKTMVGSTLEKELEAIYIED